MNTEQLIESLLDPSNYPHPVEVITTIETHISIVFLTGQYAYKLKKPVDFGFLDFSSLANRKKYCGLEVELNRRTAPELYIGVFQIESDTSDANHKIKITPQSEEGNPVDYLVKMRQFDPNHVLGRMLNQQDHIELQMLEKLALQIARFHLAANPVEMQSRLGEPKTQLQPMLDNFPTLFSAFRDSDSVEQLRQLEDWTETTFQQVTPLLIKRKSEGFVRACHGDLHLDNIALICQEPLLFDGIEFNEEFRWIDVISDLAFLLIDLDFRDQSAAAQQVLSLYLSKTFDYNALLLLDFYRIYRTLVRAKITALRGEQFDADSLQKKQVMQIAKDYINQATAYLDKNHAPKCILLQGVSGSGKSFFANQLLEELELNAIIISSDRTRKTLYGIEATHRVSAEEEQRLYSPEMNRKTYEAMLLHAKSCLQAGFSVIVDATFLKRTHREHFYRLTNEFNLSCYLFSFSISAEFAESAISLRQQQTENPSDANAEVMRNQLDYFEAPQSDENALHLNAAQLRQHFPQSDIQKFLELPITKL